MAVDPQQAFTNTDGVLFPNNAAINASGAGATDGFEFVKLFVNNYSLGPQQALLSRAGITPTGVVESASASQVIEATHKAYNVGPGIRIMSDLNSTETAKYRILPLNGQGVDTTTYADLVTATYVGDGNNVAVAAVGGAYFKSTTGDGLNPSDAGTFLILPETRGYTPRGLDVAASIDPDGASRFLGDNQGDTFQAWQLGADEDSTGAREYWGRSNTRDFSYTGVALAGQTDFRCDSAAQGSSQMLKAKDDGTNGAPRTGLETRATNTSTNFAVGY